MACYDLHLHTEWSYDAFPTVEEYFEMAHDQRVRAIAITDHHTMDGYGDVLAAAAKYPEVGYFCGAELTVHCDVGEYDLVCLNLPSHPSMELASVWELYHNWQRAYGHAVSVNLCARGFAFDDEERLRLLKTYRPAKAIAVQGNTHVRHWTMMKYCIEHGFCQDGDAYLKLRDSYTNVPEYPEFDQVIPAVKRAGGIIFLAHPTDYHLEDDRKRLDYLRELFEFDGIEAGHACMNADLVKYFREYCETYGLLSSGGSDLHNLEKKQFAQHLAPEYWLDEILERVTLHRGA